jgi:hypothetical protein
MKQFLYYWTILSRHPGYKRARIMALLTAISVGAMVYFATTDQFGWTLTLIIPFMILSTSTLDQLGWAFRSTAIAPPPPQYYDDYYEDEPYEDDDDEEGQYYEDEPYYEPPLEEALPQVQIRSQGKLTNSNYLPPPPLEEEDDDEYADYWEGDDDEAEPEEAERNQAQSEQTRLALCQLYVFIYGAVVYGYTGEKNWVKLGMSPKVYRRLVHKLAAPEYAIFKIENGLKPQVLVTELGEALQRIKACNQNPQYWEFALWFYHEQPEAAHYWRKLTLPDKREVPLPYFISELPKIQLNPSEQG